MSCNQSYRDGVLREQITNGTQPGDPPVGYTAWDTAGNVVTQRLLTTDEIALLAAQDTGITNNTNRANIQQAATTALASNRAYVGIASPTNAQVAAQVKALTQQMNGVIRLALGLFDGTN